MQMQVAKFLYQIFLSSTSFQSVCLPVSVLMVKPVEGVLQT